MRLFRYISMAGVLAVAAGCTNSALDGPDGSVEDGDMLTLDLSVNIGEMGITNTRTFEDQPDYENLHLYVAEFDDKGGPLSGNVLSNVYEAEEETVNADGDMHFKLTVVKSDQPKVLHLIAVPGETDMTIPYGLEGQVIPTLTVGNETPAYWAQVKLSEGYGSENADGNWETAESVQTSLTHVPMLRNFAKVSMSSSAPTTDSFRLTGFVVLNRASRGTVAPWDSEKQEFPAFSDGSTRYTYNQISKTIGYSGYCPVNPGVEGSIIGKSADAADFTSDAKYLYERPVSSLDNTIVVFSGTKSGVTGTRYYKLDLGKTGDDMIFRYYNVLRNFDYHINITGVQGNGYGSIEDAIKGVVQNNFSFDITTAQMLNISNGKEMLWVNQTTFVVNDPNDRTITFKYRFMPDVASQGAYNNSRLKFYTQNADGTTTDGIQTGTVITGVTYGVTPDAEGYSSVTLTTSEPGSETQEASFIIIDPQSGLGRTINVIVRNPWIYRDPQEWAGTYNTRNQFLNSTYAKDPTWENAVGTEMGSAFTVLFTLEPNIPQAMFPLEFVAESRGQNFENNKIGTLVVRSDKSLFDETKNAIQYVKTVTYADYMNDLTLGNPTGTIVKDTDGTSHHRVRMRFLTIKNLTAGYEGKIRVYNKYFKNADGGNYLEYDITVKNFSGTQPWLWNMSSETTPTNPQGK